MKKRDLEKARSSVINTHVDTDALRGRVAKDLAVVRDAYDIGATALEELRKALHSLSTSDSPAKELSYLTKAYADVVKSVVLLRDEGRTTIAYHVGKDATQDVVNEPTSSDVTPLSPLASSDRDATAHSPKISPPTRALTQTPVALNEFLRSQSQENKYSDEARKTEATREVSVRSEGSSGPAWVPGVTEGEPAAGDPED